MTTTPINFRATDFFARDELGEYIVKLPDAETACRENVRLTGNNVVLACTRAKMAKGRLSAAMDRRNWRNGQPPVNAPLASDLRFKMRDVRQALALHRIAWRCLHSVEDLRMIARTEGLED